MFSSTGLSPSTTGRSRPLRLTPQFLTVGRSGRIDNANPTTLHTQPLPGITRTKFGLIRFRSPLLTESLLFSLPVGTEMFHFPTFPPHTLYIQVQVTRHHSCWVSPFGHPRITARLTAPRGLSQPPTSFIGSWCQGIHRAPLQTWPQRCSRPLCSSQTTHGKPPHTPPPTPATPKGNQLMCTAVGARNQETHARVCSLRTQQCTDAHHPHQTTQGPAETTRRASVPPMSEPRAERTPANGATSCTPAHHPFPAPHPPKREP